MAINVTVLGADAGTVTIPVTSAANAAVAQTALAGISMAIAAGTLAQVEVTGAGSLPVVGAATGLIEQSGTTALAPLVIGNDYVFAVLDGDVRQTVVTGVNPGQIIISDAAGAVVDNLGTNTQVYFGGGDNAFTAVGSPLLGLAPTAQVYLDGTGHFDVSFGATTIFAGAGAAMTVVDTGSAGNTINLEAADAEAGSPVNTLVLAGTAATAATVNAAGAGLSVTQDGGAGLINANDSDVTVYGAAGGSVTLFGGTGTDSVIGGSGLFAAGRGGGSLLVSSTVPGDATLVGGGNGDTLQALGRGDVLMAGKGNESLLGGAAPVIAAGFNGVQPGGDVTDMTGGTGGGNVFFVGAGSTSITGNHGDAGGNVYAELTSSFKTVTITDFVSALDQAGVPAANPDIISLAMPGGGSYHLVTPLDPNAALAPDEVAFSYLSNAGQMATAVEFGDGATWTLLDCALHPEDFH